MASAVVTTAVCFTAGCNGFFVYPGSVAGGGTGTTATGDYVYVANATTDTVSGFSVGTGTLTAISNSPYTLPFSPIAVAVNPANTIVFVAGGSSIYAYAIQSGGALSVMNNGAAVGLATVESMDISPDGQWLFALDQNGASIDEFQINSSTGGLTEETTSYAVQGRTVIPRAIKVAPNGQYVFLALGTAGDLVYPFNTGSGALSAPLALSELSGTSDNALAVSSGSNFLFIARSGTSGGLAVYSIGLGGALSEVSGSPFAAGNQPFSVVLNKAGTDVYVANQLDSNISGFSVGSTGTLTALSGSPYNSGSAVTALAVDNSGDYLLAAARNGAPDLTLYSFDATTAGKLDFSASTATGTDPTEPVALAATH